jgi:hypothetical protein
LQNPDTDGEKPEEKKWTCVAGERCWFVRCGQYEALRGEIEDIEQAHHGEEVSGNEEHEQALAVALISGSTIG